MDNNKKGSPLKELIMALDSEEFFLINEYLTNYPLRTLKENIQALIKQPNENANNDLKDFTKAAMQGLCHMAGADVMIHGGLTVDKISDISECAIEIAKSTLLKLQNKQS